MNCKGVIWKGDSEGGRWGRKRKRGIS